MTRSTNTAGWRARAGVRGFAGIGLTASLLASLVATAAAPSALALTFTNIDPTVTVPTGIATNVGLGVTWHGTAPTDTLPVGTTYAVTLPAGYSWTALPTLATSSTSLTLSGPAVVGQTTSWVLTSFSLTSGDWTVGLTGGQVMTSSTSGSSTITLSVNGGAAFAIATLIANGKTGGTIVPITVSPTSVPADGTSTVQVSFGAVTVPCATDTSFTVSTSMGLFTATTLPGVTSPANATTLAIACGNFGSVSGKTLLLRASTTPGTAWITVTVQPAVGSAFVDSSTAVMFTPTSKPPKHENEGAEHGVGARKVAFFTSTSGLGAGMCASAAATPTAGSRSFGFAVLTVTARGRVNVTVSLKHAQPNATYTLVVAQSTGACSSPFMVTTNRRGNGNGHMRLTLASGATSAWVTAVSGSNVLVTRLASFTPKRGHSGDGDRD